MYTTTSNNYHHQLNLATQQQQQQQQLEMNNNNNNDYSNYQRHDSMDYSRRPSYFTGLLGGSTTSEASYSDHEQQTPSPFTGYEDYNTQQQFHHPLDNSVKRRMSTAFELPHLYQQQQIPLSYPTSTVVNPYYQPPQRCNSSPMVYANPAVDMYSPQAYIQSHQHYNPTTTTTAAAAAMAAAAATAVVGYHPLVVDNLVPSSTVDHMMNGLFRERAFSSSSSSSSDSCLSATASTPTPSSASVPATTTGRKGASKSNKAIVLNKPSRSRGRRVSNSPSVAGQKVFTCKHDDCGKVFKRSEHLKRHVRSIHTLEKPFECPYQSCSKRFSRSDNLNQHIRIHRHTGKDKNNNNNSANANTTATVSSSRNDSFSNYMPSTTF